MPVISTPSAGGAVPRAGVVVVLFRPDDSALGHLRHAHASCPDVVVVDNTPAPDTALHERLRAEGLDVLANRNAGGLARAYNVGVQRLLERGVELCFLLDQDSEIAEGFFERMAAAAEGTGREDLLIGPRIYEIRMDKYLPAWAEDDEVRRGPAVREAEILISSGSAVSAAAYRAVGPFREDLFIEWIDVEYALRARARGVGVYVNAAETLRQMQGDITRHGSTFTTNHAAWRRYYHVRNGIWTAFEHYGRWRTVPGSLRLVARECWVIARYERDKARKLLGVLAGAADGARGRLGEIGEVRPRTSRAVRAPRSPVG